MSAGPIKAWRDSHKPEQVSTTNAARVCMRGKAGRGYCGRSSKDAAADWAHVTCADCRAAARADGKEVA